MKTDLSKPEVQRTTSRELLDLHPIAVVVLPLVLSGLGSGCEVQHVELGLLLIGPEVLLQLVLSMQGRGGSVGNRQAGEARDNVSEFIGLIQNKDLNHKVVQKDLPNIVSRLLGACYNWRHLTSCNVL